MSGCDMRNFHGPELPTTIAAWREMHRAWHAFVDSVGRTQPWQWMIDMSERAAHVLALPRRKP